MSLEDIKGLALRLASLKAQADQIAKEKTRLEGELVGAMKKEGLSKTSVSVSVEGSTIKATLVEAERLVIDAEKLRARMDAKTWNKVTKQVLDNSLLEAAVAMGTVDPMVVAEVSETVQNKPYVRISGTPDAATLRRNVVSLQDDQGRTKPAMKRVRAKKTS